jgi:GNAT superfamily N-acetyltransferase
MADDWLPALQLRISYRQFQQLPRSPAYSYAWYDDTAWLNPRPRYYHALLDLRALAPAPESATLFALRVMDDDDNEELVGVFAHAFAHHLPFSGLEEGRRREVAWGFAWGCLQQTWLGGDGPWVEAASFVATDETGRLIGGILPTLLPDTDPSDWDSYSWSTLPPPDCLARGLGRPHLTWIFVVPESVGRGVGTGLLHASAGVLRGMGYTWMTSTFLVGNDSSLLWHWRNGFQLVMHPSSRRREE